MIYRFISILLITLIPVNLICETHTIGDSHAYFSFINSGFNIHHLGPITMHRVGRDALEILNFKKLGIAENDTVILSFGEIDCRTHVIKQAKLQTVTTEVIIEDLITRYQKTINLNIAQYHKLKIILLEILPPALHWESTDWPTVGTLEQRIYAVQTMNKYLYAIQNKSQGIHVAKLYDLYKNEHGAINSNCTLDGLHLAPEVTQDLISIIASMGELKLKIS
jgi:hypothetical protein